MEAQRVFLTAGTYDGKLVGWECSAVDPQTCEFALKIGTDAHVGSMKAMAVCSVRNGQLLVTGGQDESIHVYSLRTLKQVGVMQKHNGAINELHFFGRSHLLSCADDGALAIWRVSDWECLHVLGGHKSAARSFAIHPSGKLALSVGADSTLRMWDLVKGRVAYIKRLSLAADFIRWAPDGLHFAVIQDCTAYMHRASDGELAGSADAAARIQAAEFISPNLLVVGGNDKQLHVMHCNGSVVASIDTGLPMRVRALALCRRLQGMDDAGAADATPLVAAASTDGTVQLYDLADVVRKADGGKDAAEAMDGADEGEEDEEEFEVVLLGTTRLPDGMRLTCLAATPPPDQGVEAGEQAVEATVAMHVEALEASGHDAGAGSGSGAAEGRPSKRARGGKTSGVHGSDQALEGKRRRKEAAAAAPKGKGKGKGKKEKKASSVTEATLEKMKRSQRMRAMMMEADADAMAEAMG